MLRVDQPDPCHYEHALCNGDAASCLEQLLRIAHPKERAIDTSHDGIEPMQSLYALFCVMQGDRVLAQGRSG
jgi:hypothetical protein